tara:strand:+ start:288364 stop:288951 length:588 start_codon:yes stop_codon:yes gene_type:complete
MSFALTTDQFRARSKTVTRRIGWAFLQPGDQVMGCVKCMGLKPGEKIERLGLIEIVSVRREPLRLMQVDEHYGKAEAVKEGFPEMNGADFVSMLCNHSSKPADTEFNRIEFQYLAPNGEPVSDEIPCRLLRFNPRRAARGAEAAEVEIGSDVLWMSRRDISRNITEFGPLPGLLAAQSAYNAGVDYPPRNTMNQP